VTDTQVTQTLAEVAELATTTNTNVSQVILEVAYTPSVDVSTGSGSATGGGQTRGQFLPRGETVLWTVDNVSTLVTWDGLTARANGGYEQADLIIPAGGDGRWRGSVLRGAPQGMGQGSIVRAYRENGDILYEAKVAAEPQSFQGQTKFWTAGAVEDLRRKSERLPFQLAGGAGWVDRGSDPFNYGQSGKYQLFSKPGFVGWQIQNGNNYPASNKAGYALMISEHQFGNFDLELYTGTDAGALTLEKAWTVGSGHPDGDAIDYTIQNTGNTISLTLTQNGGGFTATANLRLWLTKLRMNGIGTDDSTTTSDVVAKLGNRLDYRTVDVQGSGSAALPLDWDGPWADLASQMADTDDWYWTVLADRTQNQYGNLIYSAWGGDSGERTWKGTQGEGLDCNLTVLPRYNQVLVAYESPQGVPQTITRNASDQTDLVDPLPDGDYPFPDVFTFPDVQNDNGTALAIADAALRKLTQLRAQGTITVTRMLNGAPFDILPGDLIDIGGFVPDLPPQRVVSITYKPGGTADVSVERAITVAELVTRVFRRRVRRP
jgi:hypothetical protein